jgi:formylglycine-generating enzyme required for sulfatase activity
VEKALRPQGLATITGVLAIALLVACSPDRSPSGGGDNGPGDRSAGNVTVSGDDRIAESLTWRSPTVAMPAEGPAELHERAEAALAAGRLYADADAAIPLYLALLQHEPHDARAKAGLQRAQQALLAEGETRLSSADDDIQALRDAHRVAAVARTNAPRDTAVQAYLKRVDLADQLWELNRQAEADLRAGRLGESDEGAWTKLRSALRLKPHQPRALQGLAAVESGLIHRAEEAAERGDFTNAGRWMAFAAKVRPGSSTIADARARIAAVRSRRISQLHDEGMRALLQHDGIPAARGKLAQILRIAEPGDPVASELRQRIDQATHYGLFRPGQAFTDALKLGARGPQMVVVPHGGFRMGASEAEGGGDTERPVHYVRFDRGFAMSQSEITVGQFREFVRASGYEPTATRRGYSLVYEERNGNFVRRNGADWRSAYDGTRASDPLPVVHVSARDADAYVAWLAKQSGAPYRLPSEAEFEYALRGGRSGRYPWGDRAPAAGTDNVTGAKDTSPGGRHWANAFAGLDDGYWGPAPVASFRPNAYGLHDLAGNVSEWVADCWHDGYRRAPVEGAAWLNPGCRTRVIRGGSWASSPAQTRSAWRAPVDVDTTNPRIGFRVVREL